MNQKPASEPAAPRLGVITTVPMSVLAFYKGQLKAFQDGGMATTVICADADDPEFVASLPQGVKTAPVSFTRVYSPVHDLKAILELYRLFREERFDIVQYSTPKAALLGSISAFAARVPVRIYVVWGLYFDIQRGPKRHFFKFLERATIAFSTQVLPNAHELREVLVAEGLVRPDKCSVMLNGSASGVDLEEFAPSRWASEGASRRASLGIPEGAVVVGYFSRLVGDKGANELIAAFLRLASEIPQVHLLVVGRVEEKDRPMPETLRAIESHPRIHVISAWQPSMAPCYAAVDLFCLPSYREGFPQSPLEAQAMALPVLATDIMGNREAVADGHTGFLVQARSAEALLEPLRRLVLDKDLRTRLGRNGRARIEALFDARDMERCVVLHRLALLDRAPQAADRASPANVGLCSHG